MASTAGRVNEAPEPVVAVRLVGGLAGDLEVECVVDTGFTGALVLPRAVVERLGLSLVIISAQFYGVVLFMAIATTLVVPPFIKLLFAGKSAAREVIASDAGSLLR